MTAHATAHSYPPEPQRVKFRDGEIVKVQNERINEIRPLVAGIWYALHGFRPGEAFIKTRSRA